MKKENQELIDKTNTVLDNIMAFFRKVVNYQTITDKGTIYHIGELDLGIEVYQDEALTTVMPDDNYTNPSGYLISVKGGMVLSMMPPIEDDHEPITIQENRPDTQTRLLEIMAKLHAQNRLLNDAKISLYEANKRLNNKL